MKIKLSVQPIILQLTPNTTIGQVNELQAKLLKWNYITYLQLDRFAIRALPTAKTSADDALRAAVIAARHQ